MKDVQVKIAKGEYLGIYEDRKILFEEFAEEYLGYSKANKARKTYERDLFTVRVHLIPYFKGKYLAAITPKMIEDYKMVRAEMVKPGTLNKEINTLKNLLRKAVEWKYLKASPGAEIGKVKEIVQPPRFLTEEEAARLLSACPRHLFPLVATALYAGLRKSELFHLRWEDFDFRRGTLTVRGREDWHTKNYEFRVIPLHPFLAEVLRKHPRHPTSLYVFYNPDGTLFHDIRTGLEAAAKRASIDHVTLHMLRHTFASHLVMKGVDLRTVQMLMGHKDIKTTMIYAHLAPDHLKAAVDRLMFHRDR